MDECNRHALKITEFMFMMSIYSLDPRFVMNYKNYKLHVHGILYLNNSGSQFYLLPYWLGKYWHA